MWLHDDLMRQVALSPRLGGLAADLLGEPAVRIYHDNALSKEPGCGRTPWHHDAEHFPLATLQAVTAWMPVSAVPRPMGPLSFARGAGLRPLLADLEFDSPTMISGTWQEFLPGVAPGEVAASELNPVVGRASSTGG